MQVDWRPESWYAYCPTYSVLVYTTKYTADLLYTDLMATDQVPSLTKYLTRHSIPVPHGHKKLCSFMKLCKLLYGIEAIHACMGLLNAMGPLNDQAL